ncbi:MAG: sigma 54-interacting transcriptional regulator [SAR324 cluster bacterium]|nr:sigma 54-interacting transcriptional regulator [SAR324 cluster bacterium]
MKNIPNVVIGFLGSSVDNSSYEERWEKWRPTVSLCQHKDLPITRLELLAQPQFSSLANVIVEDILSVSPQTKVNIHYIELQDPWDFEEVYGKLFDFALAYSFDPELEGYLLHLTPGTHVAQICWFLLAESHFAPAKLLQTAPPKNYQIEGPGEYKIVDLDLSKYDRIASRFRKEQQKGVSILKDGIETRNAKFNALIERIEKVAMLSEAPILLMGPTGAGKSQLAKRIYELKKMRNQVKKKLVEVNCATLRGDGAMSTLFGHKKGAFTGALQDRQGLLHAANDGILFLDEIGDLGLDEQAMLLRALEEKKFLPMGADQETESDFQLIGGTNRDLLEETQKGNFREDLFARINLWTFYLPSLKERLEDIEPNLRYELEKFSGDTGNRVTFNKEALHKFINFSTATDSLWSANFRDLNAAVTRMATLARGGRITVELVEEEILRLQFSWKVGPSPHNELLERYLSLGEVEQLDLFDKIQLPEVLQVCLQSNSLAEAGRRLFSQSRLHKKRFNDSDRLRKYLKRFGIDWKKIRAQNQI